MLRLLTKGLPRAALKLLLLVPMIWAEGALAVDCAINLLESQAEVDALGAAGCDRVSSNLEISYSADITNLDGLANLTSVGGDLRMFRNFSLTNLDGLASLTSVGGDLEIIGNARLTNLDGLASLTSVGGDLEIKSNDALTNLDGLANINSIPGSLDIRGNYYATCEGVARLLGWPNGPPNDTVGESITIRINGTGCDSVDQILASVSGPTLPVINQATTSRTGITLGFTPSIQNEVAFPITSYEAACTGTEDLSEAPASALLDNMPVSRTLTAPRSFVTYLEIDINITHDRPDHLFITLTTPQGDLLLLWNGAGAGTYDINETFATTVTPGQSMEGDWVLYVKDDVAGPLINEGVLNSWGLRITEVLAGSGSGSPIEVLGVTPGRDYACTVAPVTKLGATPVSDPYTVSVALELDVPATPTITSTDYDDGKIILGVSVSDNGGTDITGYNATCTAGTNTYTGTSTSSPITVSGLTNDVAYTCTVSATNAVGTSSSSAATAPITPEEQAAGGLPIWLLYQISK